MPVATQYPSTNTAVSGTWSNPTNAYVSNGSVASITRGTTKNSSNSRRYGGFDFDTAIPSGSTINSVAIQVRHRVQTTSNICFLENLARISAVAGATNSDELEPTTLTARSYASYARPGGGSWARADLLNAVFDVELIARNGNNATSNTWEWDYVRVVVDYTGPITSLAGEIAATSTVTGAVVSLQQLAGEIAVISTVAGGILSLETLAGEIAGISSLTGDLTESAPPAANPWVGVFGAAPFGVTAFGGRRIDTAPPSGEVLSLAGTIVGTSALTGETKASATVAGTVAGTSTFTGALGFTATLAGTIAGVATLTGDLTSGTIVSLAGTIAGVSSLSGAVKTTQSLGGSIAAISTLTSNTKVAVLLNGTIPAVSGLTGNAKLTATLSATVAGVSTLTGDLSLLTSISLGGTIAGVSSLSGNLTVLSKLAGTIAATGSFTGNATAQMKVAGTVASVSSLTGTLGIRFPLVGTISATSTFTGQVGSRQTLNGNITGVSTLTGGLVATLSLAGSIDGISTWAGFLSATGIIVPPSLIVISGNQITIRTQSDVAVSEWRSDIRHIRVPAEVEV